MPYCLMQEQTQSKFIYSHTEQTNDFSECAFHIYFHKIFTIKDFPYTIILTL